MLRNTARTSLARQNSRPAAGVQRVPQNRSNLGLRQNARPFTTGLKANRTLGTSFATTLKPMSTYKTSQYNPINMAIRQYSESVDMSDAASQSTFLPKNEVEERVINVVKNFEKVEPSKVTPEAHFMNDLGLDSLDTVELVMALENEFALDIPDDEAEKILSCPDAISYISTHPQAK